MMGTIQTVRELGLSLYEARVRGLISMAEYLVCDAWMASHVDAETIQNLGLDMDHWVTDAKWAIAEQNWFEVQCIARALWATISEQWELGGRETVDALFVLACGMVARVAGDAELGMELWYAK